MLRPLIIATALSGALTGCISISSLQTARTQRDGEMSGFFALGYESLYFPKKSRDKDEKELEEAVEELKVPIMETGLRYGINGENDFGLKYTVPGTLALDVKHQLTGFDGPVAMAMGLGVGFGGHDSESDSFKDDYDIVDLFVPFYISKDLSDTFSLYTAPRYIHRMTTYTSEDKVKGTKTEEKESASFIGASAGFAWYWFTLEAGYFTAVGTDGSAGIMQVMLGYWGGWDEVNKPRAAAEAKAEKAKARKKSSKKKKSEDED